MAEFRMPILGADMTAGTLIAWRKGPGDTVARGDVIAEVETDKGLIDVEVFASGVIERLVVQPGETVPTGTVLAIIRGAGERAVPVPAPGVAAAVAPSPPPTVRLKISPAARALAAALGVDPATVEATGPDGAITREDVERAAAARAAAAPGLRAAAGPPERMRQAIAAAMARAKREIPHYYLGTTVDLQRAMAWMAAENLQRPVEDRLLAGALFIRAVALALREVPELNATWRGAELVRSEAAHVGVAIALRGGGLVAPALRDADRRGLTDLMHGLRDLVQRARTGGLRSSELSDPTITVTSLGEQGVETVFGIIYPPQVAIVGFGTVVERPWVVAGAVVARPLVHVTLSADHRASDGHRGALFLAAVERLLQSPEAL